MAHVMARYLESFLNDKTHKKKHPGICFLFLSSPLAPLLAERKIEIDDVDDEGDVRDDAGGEAEEQSAREDANNGDEEGEIIILVVCVQLGV